jgi:hypothetical protein
MSKILYDYPKYQDSAINATRYFVSKKLEMFSIYNGLNLIPSLERFLITLFLNNKSKYNFSDSDLEIETLNKFFCKRISLKFFLRRSRLIRQVYYKILNFSLGKNVDNQIKFLCIVHHDKFIRFLNNQNIFELKSESLGWLALHSIDKDLVKKLNKSNIFKLRNIALETEAPDFISELLELAESLEQAIVTINPKALIVFEGDAPYHSLVSEIGRKYKIKTICFQWGIFYKDWRDIAFSNMTFDYFLSWGEYFSEQLKNTNKILNYVNFGYPINVNVKETPKDKIIFLGQYVAGHIKENDFYLFLKLCRSISSRMPGKILFRPHPNQKLSKQNLLDLNKSGVSVLNASEPVLDQLSQCLLAVSISSSSLIEALFCETIPVVFNPTSTDGYHIPLKLMGLGEECSEIYEAEKVILNLASNRTKIESYLSAIRRNRYKFLSDQYSTLTKRREFFENLVL